MLDDYPDPETMLINGGGTIGYAERLGRLLDQPLTANPLRDSVSPDFTQCPLSVPTTELERRVYESGSIEFELEHFNEDLIKEIFGKPSDPRFCVRYSRSITYLCYPRTVREAKARRKGNRGNRKREYSVARMDVTIPNASITHTSDGTHEVSWDVHDG